MTDGAKLSPAVCWRLCECDGQCFDILRWRVDALAGGVLGAALVRRLHLPQYASVRRWKDRRVRLELPLFPGYVFVRLALRERLRVLETPSVVRLVGFNGRPAALPDKEIEALQACAAAQINTEPHAYLTAGRRVRIKRGPLAELEGVLVRRKNGLRVVVSLDLIARSAAVEVDTADIERIF